MPSDPDWLAPRLTDSLGRYTGACLAFCEPATTEEVSQIVRLCSEHGIAIVPQGGNTNRVGAATPDASGDQVVISLRRMNRIRSVDASDFTISVDAGCVLADIQNAAEEADRLFPLSLGAEGSCMIGGNIATNAGGLNVIQYGNTRALVLGLEVVLADGTVWDGMRRLVKDNRGYDLKQMFIGSEGTLGVITGAVLRLFPAPKVHATALCSLDDLDGALKLLSIARNHAASSVCGFEVMSGITLATAEELIPDIRRPFDPLPDWTVLLELSDPRADHDLGPTMEALLAEALEDGAITDAILATSEAQRANLWRYREAIVAAGVQRGAVVRHDVSVPVSEIPDFVRACDSELDELLPGVVPYVMGHMGDGNLHYHMAPPDGMSQEEFAGHVPALDARLYDITARFNGSFSAEHGVGQAKTGQLETYLPGPQYAMAQAIKKALDPKGLMNPGKVFPAT
ncbi:FAD-binding oxidoreductase [Oceanicola sp. 22II-s10i]|uniref:FAD-binding oxidoreductase n=1 Tax=Oceanicola sp. 22II-s10i TaxID=1317116 RepID=UPI001C3D33E3|nr:FAD-binding oxidoreductase [Oceanicola sp. 22II-s10i]